MQEKLAPRKLYNELQSKRSKGFDVTLTQHLKQNYEGMEIGNYYATELAIDPASVTVGQILDRPDEAVRWIVPEIFRDAIRLGFINNPLYKDFIIREEATAQPTQVAPFWDMTGLENEPRDLEAGESMELGTIKYGQKTIHIGKSGIGLEIVDEAIRYSTISFLSIFLQDVGVKLGSKLSRDLISCLINGDQADGSEAAPVIGVATANQLTYGDFIKVFVRGSLRARKWLKVIGNENMTNYLLNMDEFRKTNKTGNPELRLNVKTPVPSDIDVYVHSSVPDNQLIMVDPTISTVQLTAVPLAVEADRLVQRQMNGTYVSITTGFANIFRDGRIILDKSQVTGFPAWLAPLF